MLTGGTAGHVVGNEVCGTITVVTQAISLGVVLLLLRGKGVAVFVCVCVCV